jgi:hypothetical protein
MLEMFLLLTEFTEIILHGILRAERTADNAVIPFYNLIGRFQSE